MHNINHRLSTIQLPIIMILLVLNHWYRQSTVPLMATENVLKPSTITHYSHFVFQEIPILSIQDAVTT